MSIISFSFQPTHVKIRWVDARKCLISIADLKSGKYVILKLLRAKAFKEIQTVLKIECHLYLPFFNRFG